MNRNNSTTPEREKGQHLGFEERCSIKTCKKLGMSLRKIADVVNCSASTVLNELRRGTGKRNGNRGRFPEYSAKRGQANYEANRSRCHKPHKLEEGNPFIDWMTKIRWYGKSIGPWIATSVMPDERSCFQGNTSFAQRRCTVSSGQAICQSRHSICRKSSFASLRRKELARIRRF